MKLVMGPRRSSKLQKHNCDDIYIASTLILYHKPKRSKSITNILLLLTSFSSTGVGVLGIGIGVLRNELIESSLTYCEEKHQPV